MKHKDTQEQTSALPSGKVKPLKIIPLTHSDGSEQTSESQETQLNSELIEVRQNNDQVIAPDGSPDPKQDQTPLY